MDFLGLTTLTVIDDCLKLINQHQGVTIDMATIDLDDQVTYEESVSPRTYFRRISV